MYTLVEVEGKDKRVLYNGMDRNKFEQTLWSERQEYHLEYTERIVKPTGEEYIIILLKVKR